MKENVTSDGTIAGWLVVAALYGAISGGIAWTSGGNVWWVGGAALLGILVAAVAHPPRQLWLEGDILVTRIGLRVLRLPLREVRSIYVNWIPRGGDQMVFVGEHARIQLLELEEGSADLRKAIGRIVPRGAVDRGKARDLLFLSHDG